MTPRSYLLFYTPLLLVLFAVPVLSMLTEVPMPNMLVDPAAIVPQSRLLGLVSNLGALLWAAALAAQCLMLAVHWLERRLDQTFWFLLYFTGFTAVLLLDDFFLLHEGFSNLFKVDEHVVFGSYFLALGAGLYRFRNVIRSTEYRFLWHALLCFAAALLLGPVRYQLQAVIGETRVLVEAGFKFIGIAAWFGYFALLLLQRVNLKPPAVAGDDE